MESSFRFSASPFLFLLFSAAAVVAVAGILWIIAIPPPPRIFAAGGMAAMFAFAVRRYALLRGKNAVRGALFLSGGEVELFTASGVYRGRLQSASISPLLATFVADCGGRRFNVPVAFDCLPKDRHRQLRVRLKMNVFPPPPAIFSLEKADSAAKKTTAQTDGE